MSCSGHGRCVGDLSGYTCVCDSGYEGSDCGGVACPCRNGGQCVRIDFGGRACLCPRGFIGPECEIVDTSVCVNVTCSGHGFCQPNDGGGFRCACNCKSILLAEF